MTFDLIVPDFWLVMPQFVVFLTAVALSLGDAFLPKELHYRWLTVQHPEQPSFQLGLFAPQPPTLDAATAQQMRELVAKGAMPPLVMTVADCRATCEQWRARGVELTQEPIDRFGTVDAGFRDPSGNGWKLIQAR